MNSYKDEIINILDQLPEEKVLEVLGYAEFLKDRVDFVNRLTTKGIIVTELIEETQEYLVKWEEKFTNHLTQEEKREIYFDEFLWHVFSFEKIKCMKEEEARTKFNAILKRTCFVFYQHLNVVYKLEHAGELEVSIFDNEQDVYIVDENFRWTYVHTHESSCGPYFYQQMEE